MPWLDKKHQRDYDRERAKLGPRYKVRQLTCVFCGKIFNKRISPSRLIYRPRQYCSIVCGKKGGTQVRMTGQLKRCVACGEQFYIHSRSMQKYCNTLCFRKHYLHSYETKKKISSAHTGRKHNYGMYGKDNPAWRGGVYPLNEAVRHSIPYQEWRDKVFKRDKYRCVHCGLRSGWHKELKRRVVLQADHIKPFSLYPELRFEVTNGRTLCVECHRKTDTFAGKCLLHKHISGIISLSEAQKEIAEDWVGVYQKIPH